MNFKEENIERFDQYIENEMTAHEKNKFEAELIEDGALKAEFDSYKLLIKTLSNAEITSFTEKLKVWDETDEEPRKKRTQIYSLRFMLTAAAVILGVVLTSTYFFKSPTPGELIVANFEPYPNIHTVRGAAEDIDQGLLLYDQEDYTGALQVLERYPKNPTALFYAGEANMSLQGYQKAASHYEMLLEDETVFSEIASFHLSLAYLGLNRIEDAKTILTGIKSASDYHEAAQTLLSDLK